MREQALYRELAPYYDKFYWTKDYAGEVDFLTKVFHLYGVKVQDILEVACGTGSHTKILAGEGFRVTGVDINTEMLHIAREKLGRRARFIRGNMQELQDVVASKAYDAAICLFSSISYNQTVSELEKTLKGMYTSVRPGGLVAFDTRFTRQVFPDGYRGEDIFDDGKAMGARLSVAKKTGDRGEISLSYLIYDSPKIVLIRNDIHRLGLFNRGELRNAMRSAGLENVRVFNDWAFGKGVSIRGFIDTIFVGRKPLS